MRVRNFLRHNIWIVIGLLVGAVGGFIYWRYVGCESGNCAITSDPINSSIYGSLVGGVLFSFKKSSSER